MPVTPYSDDGPQHHPRLIPRIPSGAYVECHWWNPPTIPSGKKYDRVEDINEMGCQFQTSSGKFAKSGIVEIIRDDRTKTQGLKFVMRVPAGTKLGPHRLKVTGDGVPDTFLNDSFRVSNPLVIIVDIDGMRQDVFDKALEKPEWKCPTLRKLAGDRTTNTDNSEEGSKWKAYEHGVEMLETTTIFPSVTFLGHAAIFTGAEPGKLGMAGNEWFDRTIKKKFAFTGDNLGPGLKGSGDAMSSFSSGVANDRLRKSEVNTVYQDAAEVSTLQATSIVIHNMYFGNQEKKSASWHHMSLINQAEYYFTMFTPMNDQAMLDKALKEIRKYNFESWSEDWSQEEYDRLSILTLYFGGLDHLSHELGDPRNVEDRQKDYLAKYIDKPLGEFLNGLSSVTYQNATFLFTADHGQTSMTTPRGADGADIHCFKKSRSVETLHKFQDLLYEWGYAPAGVYGFESVPLRPWSTARPVIFEAKESASVVGLNGGMAHIYLRRRNDLPIIEHFFGHPTLPKTPADHLKRAKEHVSDFRPWEQQPKYDNVLIAAKLFWTWNKETNRENEPKEYKDSLDLILVRNQDEEGGKAEYKVYRGPDKKPIEFFTWLKIDDDGKNFLKRYGWKDDRDAEYLANRVRQLAGPMSGDLILLPRYPDFYCEYEPLFGDHGSLAKTDMEIPFVVLRPGAGEKQLKAINEVLSKSVKPRKDNLSAPKKNRPSNTDVKLTVLELLRVLPTIEEAVDKLQQPVPESTAIGNPKPDMQRLVIPLVVGLTASEAKAKLIKNGFAQIKLVTSGEDTPSADRAFTVQAQEPRGGTKVERTQTVTLHVYPDYRNSNPSPHERSIEVPDLVGKAVTAAKAALLQRGLKFELKAADSPPPVQAQEFTVQAQSLPGGAKVQAGTSVSLNVYSRFERADPVASEDLVEVPNVVGQSAKLARELLVQKGFKVSATAGERPKTRALAFTVQSQSPSFRSKARPGSTVAIRVFPSFESPEDGPPTPKPPVDPRGGVGEKWVYRDYDPQTGKDKRDGYTTTWEIFKDRTAKSADGATGKVTSSDDNMIVLQFANGGYKGTITWNPRTSVGQTMFTDAPSDSPKRTNKGPYDISMRRVPPPDGSVVSNPTPEDLVEVPNVVGLSAKSAGELLTRKGFKYSPTVADERPKTPAQQLTVRSQSPPSRSKVKPGSTIALRVFPLFEFPGEDRAQPASDKQVVWILKGNGPNVPDKGKVRGWDGGPHSTLRLKHEYTAANQKPNDEGSIRVGTLSYTRWFFDKHKSQLLADLRYEIGFESEVPRIIRAGDSIAVVLKGKATGDVAEGWTEDFRLRVTGKEFEIQGSTQMSMGYRQSKFVGSEVKMLGNILSAKETWQLKLPASPSTKVRFALEVHEPLGGGKDDTPVLEFEYERKELTQVELKSLRGKAPRRDDVDE
jgi:beta-lactam-binding protein with PASTA domain